MSCRLSSYFRLAKLALLKPTSFPAFVFRSVHSNFILRPYQEQCIQSCVEALNSGVSRIGVSAPTGSGKTTIFVSLLGRLPATKSGAGRALIIVSSVELARQAAEQVTRIFPDLRVEIEQGQKYKATGAADVTVATRQTLENTDRLRKFDPAGLKVIIVDEAHHAAAPSYLRILRHFDESIVTPEAEVQHKVPIIGFSATFSRHDGLALGKIFQRIVYHRDFLEMIKEQWLCNVRFTSVRASIDLSEVTMNSRTGDFNPTSLSHVINTDTVNSLVVQTWLDRAATRKSTLVFCVTLAHVRELTNTFRKAGVDARYLHAGTPAGERKTLIEDFKKGTFPVLVNCAILTEGADIPNIDCVVLARPTRSRNLFAQMMGRGMRLSPATGKEDCHIIDFVDTVKRIGVVSTPTLFGLEPDDPIEDETPESLEARASEKAGASLQQDASHVPNPTSITYEDYDDPFALVNNAAGSPHVNLLSRNAWVSCGGDVYILECIGKGFIKVQEVDDESGERWESFYTPANTMDADEARVRGGPSRSHYFRKRKVLSADTLSAAIRGSDTYARTKVALGNLSLALLRSAKWRMQPASEGQRDFLEKRLKGVLSSEIDTAPLGKQAEVSRPSLSLETLTKGEAANIINRLKHGAQGWYDKKKRKQLKENEVMEKERQRKAREQVRVGPLSAYS